ncbi:MAG: dihydroorotate dehydrogenase [Planctomycetota bacterium]
MDALSVDLAGLKLSAPVLLAAGTAGTIDEFEGVVDLSKVGALVTKSITPEPREGNAPWRVAPLKAGMLNAIGLANPGIERFCSEHAPRIAQMPCPVVVSVAGFSVEDYVHAAGAVDQLGVAAAIELNVSCPNVHGTEFGADPALLSEVVKAVREATPNTRIFAKLPPVVVATPNSIVDLARSAIEPAGSAPSGPNQRPGVDGLTLCNTTPGMAIDVRTRKPKIGNVTGGLSGPSVHNAVVRLVHLAYTGVARDSGTPIIGLGGVLAWDDAAELILAGASAVQIGTALFVDVRTPAKVTKGLERWVRDQRADRVSALVGAMHTE